MVAIPMNKVRAANAELVKAKPYVAVFTGATSGIGENSVRAMARTFGKQGDGLRVYFSGRTQAAGEATVAYCKDICPAGSFTFIKGDLSLMKEVDRVCDEITKTEQKIASSDGQTAKVDLLVATQGALFLSRESTEEGLEQSMSLFYYSRMRCVVQLLPLLTASPQGGHVVSVINPNAASKLHIDDLMLKDPKNFSMMTGMSHMVHLTNFFMEELAIRNPGRLALCHNYPGAVATNFGLTKNVPFIFRFVLKYVIGPVFMLMAVSNEVNGDRTIFMASSRFPPRSAEGIEPSATSVSGLEIAKGTDGVLGGGSYTTDSVGGIIATKEASNEARKAGAREKIYEHTMQVFKTIEAEGVYKS